MAGAIVHYENVVACHSAFVIGNGESHRVRRGAGVGVVGGRAGTWTASVPEIPAVGLDGAAVWIEGARSVEVAGQISAIVRKGGVRWHRGRFAVAPEEAGVEELVRSASLTAAPVQIDRVGGGST